MTKIKYLILTTIIFLVFFNFIFNNAIIFCEEIANGVNIEFADIIVEKKPTRFIVSKITTIYIVLSVETLACCCGIIKRETVENHFTSLFNYMFPNNEIIFE